MKMCQKLEGNKIPNNDGIKLESNVKRWLGNMLVEETAKFIHVYHGDTTFHWRNALFKPNSYLFYIQVVQSFFLPPFKKKKLKEKKRINVKNLRKCRIHCSLRFCGW